MADVPSGQETAQETARRPAKRTPRTGKGQLYAGGVPGNKGGGRTPDEFKRLMQSYATSAEAQAGIAAILKNPKHPAFLGALKHVTEHGYGKPAQDITSGGKPLVPAAVNVKLVKPDEGG